MKRLISFFPNKKPSAPAKYAGAKGISSRYHPDSAWLQHKSNHALILGTCSYQTVTWLASIPTYISGLKLRDELYMYSNVSVLTNPTLCDNQVHFFPFIVFIIIIFTSTNRKINFSSGTVSFVYQKTLHSCKHTQGRRVSLRVPPWFGMITIQK